MILKCLQYSNIRVGMARQTLTQIKKNSISTFNEVIRNFGISDEYYKYNEQKGEISFNNGSKIIFFELQYLPSDPDYDRFGGALLTFGVIEEAAGTNGKGKQIFSSRLARWMNDIYNIPPHLYMTTNPGVNYVYSDFYIPWVKGELEKHRMYIPAIVSDNHYQSKYYASSLKSRLDESNAKRLLDGDWDFDHDSSRLIKYNKVTDIFNDVVIDSSLESFISADIAFTSDKCIILVWKGYTIIKIINYKGGEPELEIERLVDEYSVKPNNIVYDADGVGKYLKKKMPRAYDFINNSSAINGENYSNIKSQVYFKLAELINEGKIKCIDDSFMDEMIQEIYEIKSKPLEETEGKLSIVSKKDVKKVIGRSPDISDAVAFRMVFELKKRFKPGGFNVY